MENCVADIPGVFLILLGLTGQQQTMGHGIGKDKLYVGGNHVIPALHPCHSPAHGSQRHGSTGRRALTEIGMIPGGGDQTDDVLENVVGGIGVGHLVLNGDDDILVRYSGDIVERIAGLLPAEKLQLIFRSGIAHGQTHHKPVHLRIRQQLSAGGTVGVLGGDDHKRTGQGMGHAVHGDLTLLHSLQQSGLGAGGGTVQLVGQKQITEDRALLIFRGAPILIENREAGDVGGHHVGGELHPAIVQLQGLGEGNSQSGFAHAGLVLQQQMASGQHGEEGFQNHIVLTDNGTAYLGKHLFSIIQN